MRWRAGLTTERPAGMGMDDRAKASWAQSSAAAGPGVRRRRGSAVSGGAAETAIEDGGRGAGWQRVLPALVRPCRAMP